MNRRSRGANGAANGGRGGKGGKGSGGGLRKSQPSQFASNVSFGHTYRFVSTNATPTGVTVGSLLAAAGNVCTVSNSTVTSFFGSVKVNRIAMWAPPAAQGSSATASVNWIGAANSSNREVSDTTVSTAIPAHVNSRPPINSLASFWSNGSNAAATLFTLVAPPGTIIDVSMSLILQDDDAIDSIVDTAVATATFTNTYYLSLDPNATHRYTPVSLTSTV